MYFIFILQTVLSEVLSCVEVQQMLIKQTTYQVVMCFLWLRSPSVQYNSVCISSSLETVLLKAKISSSAVNRVSRSAVSCRERHSQPL